MKEINNLDTKDCITPKGIAQELAEKVMPDKANFRKSKTWVLAIAAGALIAFGAHVSLTVMTGSTAISWGFAKLLGAITFATSLMMVVLTGAELFTGNIMMMFSVINKKTSIQKLLRNWMIVYFGNFIGALIVSILVYLSGCSHSIHEELGVLGLTTAHTKTTLTFVEAFTRGILCNWLVCLAIWMAAASRHVIGKIFAIFFPIVTFVASGYEHCVANMYFLTNGLLLKATPAIVSASGLSVDVLNTLNLKSCIVANLIPVTLGNILGSLVFVVLIFWTAYLREDN